VRFHTVREGMDPPPDALLGPEHPLARVLARRRLALERALLVGVLLAAGGVALAAGLAAALPLVVAAGVVELVLVGLVVALGASRRARVLELISAGGGDMPIAAVEQAGARLRSDATRRRLARDLDELGAAAAAWTPVFPPQRLTFDPVAIAAVAADLEEISARLRSGQAGVAGIALLERSLGDGSSPLYGADPELLRQHLHRIRFLLA
jgi:hypothetical protein